jgi:hypothetical protein
LVGFSIRMPGFDLWFDHFARREKNIIQEDCTR